MKKINDVLDKYYSFRDEAEYILKTNNFAVTDDINVNVRLGNAISFKPKYCKFKYIVGENAHFQYWMDKIPEHISDVCSGEFDIHISMLDSETIKQLLSVLAENKHIKYL